MTSSKSFRVTRTGNRWDLEFSYGGREWIAVGMWATQAEAEKAKLIYEDGIWRCPKCKSTEIRYGSPDYCCLYCYFTTTYEIDVLTKEALNFFSDTKR